jgi:two-component system sensor histidine kinase PhoQ
MLRSLHSRLLLVAGVVLAAFLGGAALIIDHGFRDSALSGVQERLKAQIFALLGIIDLDNPGKPLGDTLLPEPALAMPESGHYAQVQDTEGRVVWRSRSMLGLRINWPDSPPAGDFVFDEARSSTGERLYCLGYRFQWEPRNTGAARPFNFQVCEGRRLYARQVRRFQRTLGFWFGGLGVLLLFIQIGILRWGLKPLRRLVTELGALEEGRQRTLEADYPRELQALVHNLNVLLGARESHLQRYRNALGDLAHSLKTPLAVIRTTLESDARAISVREILREPVDQLEATVRYQLQRAATAGRSALAQPVKIAPVVERLLSSLRKVYHARGLVLTGSVAPGVTFPGDQGDLMEIIGNLADNACKWARTQVKVEVSHLEVPGSPRPTLRILVSDDGPGLPKARLADALQRGIRLDEKVEGQGIGLATVRDIVEGAYHGVLNLDSDSGGTRVEVLLQFP